MRKKKDSAPPGRFKSLISTIIFMIPKAIISFILCYIGYFILSLIIPKVIADVIFTVLWIGFNLMFSIFIYSAFRDGDKERVKIKKLEAEEELRKEQLPEARIPRLLDSSITYGESSNLINQWALSVKEDVSKEMNSTYFQPTEFIKSNPIELYLDNDDMFEHLQKEKQLIDSCYLPPAKISLIQTLEQEKIYHVPMSFMKIALGQIGFTDNAISTVSRNVTTFNIIRNEALDYLEKELAIIGAGVTGERRVNEELELYGDFWKVFSNVRFEVDGKSVETDNIIVCSRGVFAIEVKNYSPNGTYAITISKDGQWLKEYPNGNLEPMDKDVTSQLNRHIALKQRLVNTELKKKLGGTASYVTLNPMIVLANDTVRVNNETDLPIIRISQIYHHVLKQPEILSVEQINAIAEIIEQNILPVKKYGVKSYSSILERMRKEISSNRDILSVTDRKINESMEKCSKELLVLSEKYHV